MSRTVIRRAFMASMGAALLAACLSSPAALATPLGVDNPRIHEPPPGQTVLGAFMILKNEGPAERVLVAVDSPEFARIELHKTIMEAGGMGRMVPQPSLTIPAQGELVLEPGGFHIMLYDPTRVLKEGDQVALELKFQDGERQTVLTTVKRMAGVSGMKGMAH